ncbi:LPS-assembly protein LptD [Ideonella sp. A 288]|uniref:LPS-assembly protein LptD n=1 Tax=Ideonella sp. A 288 TaxID=1962181 RepID=UPI000B4AC702|nr:LPS assembly protein LptD [Ideonella sp. A 288]
MLAPLAAAVAGAWAEPRLQTSPSLSPPPAGESSRQRPVFLLADELRVRPDLDAVAEGRVEFRRAGMVIRADRFTYDNADDLARARGNVEIRKEGNVYKGPELQLRVQRFEGFFLQPEFELGLLGSGGRAERIDFIDDARSVASKALYSSCPRDGSGDPDWLLQADRVKLDVQTQEGRAEGAVLRFLGTPILALPVISFPLSDARKSGWLPPNVGLDSRSGFELGIPYYWNIAPHRDATITPTLRTRRGLSAETEFRYLEPGDRGRVVVDLLPYDRVFGGSRRAWLFEHDGQRVDGVGVVGGGLRYRAKVQRVSDQDYWKDFPTSVPSATPRLLPADLGVERSVNTWLGPGQLYARALHWQVLQTDNADTTIDSPYQRSPQIGLRVEPALMPGWRASLETEFNRFTRPDGTASARRPTGWRWHALGQISRPWITPGAWVTPKLAFNAAAYSLDAAVGLDARHPGRIIPTASVDAGLVFERESHWFGQTRRQTLEPRMLYVNTPYRDQLSLPNFDSADREFNLVSLFGENAFSGVDRVSDAHQLTLGLSTRVFDAASGAQILRLALGQRVLFRDRRVLYRAPDDTTVPAPFTQRLSDVLLEGSTSVVPRWQLDAALQYNPDSSRVVRSILGASFSPGPFQTLSAGYRYSRGLSEQVELAWQWPVYRGQARPVGASSGCGGTLYGVGRVNYSMRDSRITESIVGLEYDARCWIGRIVSQRVSTGASEATTRLMLQLELVGLSRIGANSLQVLKDNVPGYQLLRDPRRPDFRDAAEP